MVDFKRILEEEREDPALAEDRRRARMEDFRSEMLSDDQPAEPVDPDADWKAQPFSFLAGTAGTGKSFYARDWATRERGVVLAATTGIAAINLGGTTINGLLSYFDTASLREAYVAGFLASRLSKLHKAGLRRIILDEVSMLDGEQLTILTKVLDEMAGIGFGIGFDEEYADAPDGVEVPEEQDRAYPIGLTLVGDFAQLPPVKAPFAFESPEWARYDPHTKKLTEIRRQVDREFVEALQAVRRGEPDQALAYFAPQLQPLTDNDFDGPTLLARNEMVWRFNGLRLDKLKTPRVNFTATRWGTQRGEWKLIPERLELKEQALVMILANARDEYGRLLYVNGDLGDLLESTEDCGQVRLRRTGEIVQVAKVQREVKVPLEVGRAKALKLAGQGDRIDGRWEVTGAITYMPLRLAWATTVHKSQGLSLDQVQVNINDHFFSTPGMLYVALSRARTSGGLRLVGRAETFRARCTVDQRVRPWL